MRTASDKIATQIEYGDVLAALRMLDNMVINRMIRRYRDIIALCTAIMDTIYAGHQEGDLEGCRFGAFRYNKRRKTLRLRWRYRKSARLVAILLILFFSFILGSESGMDFSGPIQTLYDILMETPSWKLN
ncbi:MAG: hypothetical protein II855_04515 [Candidatus Methanomethylophilaceae archaeon]|nr:hypothetical protein [Candidatus Methanomethylophilaceae archaeon]